jgi:alpha-galactosidase
MSFSAGKLPDGLSLDAATGIITGSIAAKGTFAVTLKAANPEGTAERPFKIVCGDTLALTPPMGWNDWYSDYNRISDERVRDAADRMAANGMADAGYQYVDIDDCWSQIGKAREASDASREGPGRDAAGNLLPNRYFPDMKALTDYIHAKGLKAGIYSSPGRITCAGFAASYGHEAQDARQFAAWGFDLLKYDWCSYRAVVPADQLTVEARQKPYRLMGGLLRAQNRDVVYNLCQYGEGEVWKWGEDVGAQSWRTSGDLGDHLNQIFEVALGNIAHGAWSKPGSWNDPDYIQIGWVGNDPVTGLSQPSKLSPDEQYAFMSLWSLMAAPLFFSGDLSRMDAFTLSVLCNPEVIAVDQDSLGRCAHVVGAPGDTFVLVKELEGGNLAVGLCNRSRASATVGVRWTQLGLSGRPWVRDLWRERTLGSFSDGFLAEVAPRGVVLIQVIPAADSGK